MKKCLSIVMVLVLICSFAACAKGTETADATPAPEAVNTARITTEAPSEEPEETPAATNAAFEGDVFEGVFKEIRLGIPMLIDLDCDEANDTVLITMDEVNDEGWIERSLCITITLAANPDKPFSEKVEQVSSYFSAVAVDCDPNDNRREIVVGYDDERSFTLAFRVKDDGSEISIFIEKMLFTDGRSFYEGFPENYAFDPGVGLPCAVRTDILGTFYVNGRFTVTADGIVILSDMYSYPFTEAWPGDLILKKEITLTLLDESFNKLESVTLPIGTVISPRYTDLTSCVIVKLEDGRLAEADVRIVENDDGREIYINDVLQDELAQIPYAD